MLVWQTLSAMSNLSNRDVANNTWAELDVEITKAGLLKVMTLQHNGSNVRHVQAGMVADSATTYCTKRKGATGQAWHFKGARYCRYSACVRQLSEDDQKVRPREVRTA